MRFGANKLTVVAVALATGLGAAEPAAAVERVSGQYVQSIDTSRFAPSSPDPAGIVYDAAADRFIVSDSEVEETPLYAGHNLWTLPRGSRAGTGIGNTVGYQRSLEPAGLGFDPLSKTLYVTDDDADKVFIDRPGSDGAYGVRDGVFKVSTLFGIGDPEAIEYDPKSRHLYICDGSAVELNDIDSVNGVFGDGDDTVRKHGLAAHGMRDCEGLGLDTGRDLLLAIDPTRRQVFEITRSGALVRVVDVSGINTGNTMLASVALAPSSVDPARLSYWIADRHLDNGPFPDENDGLIHEVLLPDGTPTPTPTPTPTVTSTPTPTPTPSENVRLTVPVRAGADDGDEILASGAINRSGGDLELGSNQGDPTVTALRFSGLQVPHGARIVSATVQFNADELDRAAASLTLRAHAADTSASITSTAFGLSSRPATAASVVWEAPTWTVFGASGAEQRTPDLSAVVQEVVDRPGWQSGNALMVLVRGTGRRTAESFEGGFPPVLNLEFATP